MDIEYINQLLSNNIKQETKILIALSGGVDSMTIFDIVYSFFIKNNFNTKYIFIGHYNHSYRKESDIEQTKLSNYFADKNINRITEKYIYQKFDENTLRSVRRNFLNQIINQYQINFVLTGHNLDDQIETTIINQIRGSSIKGTINMQILQISTINQKLYIYHKNYLGVLRLLLRTKKKYIYNYANSLGIIYYEDKTNQDPNISFRNFIRKQIRNLTKLSDDLYDNFVTIHQDLVIKLANIYSQDIANIYIIEHKCYSRYIDFDKIWLIENNGIRSTNQLVYILDQFGLANNISYDYINDLRKYVLFGESGYKQLSKNYRLYVSHRKIYIIKYSDNNKSNNIYNFNILYQKEKLKYSELILRLPKIGDHYHGKTINEYLSNRKIPVFLRKYTLLSVNDKDKILGIVL